MTTNLVAKAGRPGDAQTFLRNLLARSLACAGLMLLLGVLCFASENKPPDYALIFGTVWTADNRPLMGATIKIRRSDEKKPKWVLTSDRRGEFAQRVPVGTADYVVWAEVPKKKGHAAETTVHIEKNERADIGLHLKE